MKKAECAFCRILAGELPASFVYRDSQISAFMDINPINPGHILVIPNDHYERFNEVPGAIAAKLFEVAQKINSALPSSDLKIEGTNFFLSDGEVAGQEVPHSHLHITPRFKGDGHQMGFAGVDPKESSREHLDSQATKIRSALAKTEYRIQEMSTDEFWPLFRLHAPKIFDKNELILRPYDMISDEEKSRLDELSKKFADSFRIHLGLFKGSDFVGWSWGYQDTADSFYMVNSAILPEHRGRGLYKMLLEEMLSKTSTMGFQRIYSRHSQTNPAILIPKLKRGFQITSFELSDVFGSLVHLTYFTNPTRRKVLDFRAGHLRPDEELKSLFKL